MTLEAILEGLEKALELERELGVREVETDLAAPSAAAGAGKRAAHAPAAIPAADAPPGRDAPPQPARPPQNTTPQIAFLLDKPLDLPAARTMMENIAAYMEKLSGRKTPVVSSGEPPAAEIYVLMGDKAMAKWFPGETFPAGRIWQSREGKTVALTRNPDDVARFGSPSSTKEIRRRMQQTFLAIQQRLAGK